MLTAGVALVCACLATIAGLVGLLALRPSWRRRGGLLRFGIVGALSATAASLLYLVHTKTGDAATLVISDIAMVLAPGLVFAGLGSLSGGVFARAGIAVSLAAVVGVVSTTVGMPASLAVKVVVVAVACGLTSAAARQPAIAARRGSRLLAVTMAAYGVFSVCRAVVGLTAGWDSPLYRAALSVVPTTVAGAALVLLTGVALLMILSDRSAALAAQRERAAARLERERGPTWAVALGSFDIVRAALGPARADRMKDDLVAAARTLDPDAVVDAMRTGTRVRIDGDQAAVEEALRDRLAAAGWTPGEVGLVSVEAATSDEAAAAVGDGAGAGAR
ncbi:hypothetical protein [Microbacterium arborescens]|uniref:hypothetical protein n=1 Tax=Microbacterium arborescens TaxID=33883 RepID=UPI00277F6C38|nr:hypothetical protein [Microbacterium arborescens]MDQ1217293.1 hypothetical protein [Microbacterium arborescens]